MCYERDRKDKTVESGSSTMAATALPSSICIIAAESNYRQRYPEEHSPLRGALSRIMNTGGLKMDSGAKRPFGKTAFLSPNPSLGAQGGSVLQRRAWQPTAEAVI